MKKIRKFLRWYAEPFRTQRWTHDRTYIEFRRFPLRLRIQAIESTQERLDRGGVVMARPGVEFVTRPLTIHHSIPTTVVGHNLFLRGDADSAMKIQR